MYTINKWKSDVQQLVQLYYSLVEYSRDVSSVLHTKEELYAKTIYNIITKLVDKLPEIVDIDLYNLDKSLYNISTLDTIVFQVSKIIDFFNREDIRKLVILNLNIRDKKQVETIIDEIKELIDNIELNSNKFIENTIENVLPEDLENIPESIFKKYYKRKSKRLILFLILVLSKLNKKKYIEYFKDSIFLEDIEENKNTNDIISMGLTFNMFSSYKKVDSSEFSDTSTIKLQSTLKSSNMIVKYKLHDMIDGPIKNILKRSGINHQLIQYMNTINIEKIDIKNKTYISSVSSGNGSIEIIETLDDGKTFQQLVHKDGKTFPPYYKNILRGPKIRLHGYNNEIYEIFNEENNKIKYIQKKGETINLGALLSLVTPKMTQEDIFVKVYEHLYKISNRTLSKYNKVQHITLKLLRAFRNKKRGNMEAVVDFNYFDTL